MKSINDVYRRDEKIEDAEKEAIRRQAFADAAKFFEHDKQLDCSSYYVESLKKFAASGLR